MDCTAVICDGSALIAVPHLVSRKKEVNRCVKTIRKINFFINILLFKTDIIRCFLRKEGLNIIEITDPMATIDGSDVLFTGREFFVGLSRRTNILGAKALASAFPG